MAFKTVTVELFFEEEREYDDYLNEEYVYYRLTKLQRVHSDLPDEAILGIQESLFQSNFAYIDLPNGLIDVLDKKEVRLR